MLNKFTLERAFFCKVFFKLKMIRGTSLAKPLTVKNFSRQRQKIATVINMSLKRDQRAPMLAQFSIVCHYLDNYWRSLGCRTHMQDPQDASGQHCSGPFNCLVSKIGLRRTNYFAINVVFQVVISEFTHPKGHLPIYNPILDLRKLVGSSPHTLIN